MADKLKWLVAALLVGGAVGAFYYFGDESLLMRVIGLLAVLGAATAVIIRTESGEAMVGFGRGALTEIRKVVWPTRKETTQTTIIVLIMVIIVGIILWLFDTFLGWVVRLLTRSQGG